VNPALQQFLSVALPIMVTLVATIGIAQWSQNKRFDDVNKRIDDLRLDFNHRFDAIEQRLERIESKLEIHDQRITRLEERTLPAG
jgi:archaellum component FlaC